jgi:predicted lipoprotein with Yx(FWY)xxD motif
MADVPQPPASGRCCRARPIGVERRRNVKPSEDAVNRRTGRISGGVVRVSALVSVMALVGVSVAVAASRTTIRTVNNAKYGRLLIGPSKHSLYVYCPGTSTNCLGHPSARFPRMIASGRVIAASGSHLVKSKLSTRKLSNGRHQVIYYGQPLYHYKGDRRPGQTKGENKFQGNGAWFLISNTGRPIPPPGY